MMKTHFSVKEMEIQAAEALDALLRQVPILDTVEVQAPPPSHDDGVDLVARVQGAGRTHLLLCQVTAAIAPRPVRIAVAAWSLHGRSRFDDRTTPVLIAPYLSPAAQAICIEAGMGFLDLEGNARLAFDGVFIERRVAARPPVERRELRSIFKPKSARILRVLLRDPAQCWKVSALAAAAGVSLGHVSNIRTALLNREWAVVEPDGLTVTKPDRLLDAWRDAFEAPAGERSGFYTVLHGRAFEEAARSVLGVDEDGRGAAFSSFSAANWLAPYARTGSQFFYADETGFEALRHGLKLAPAAKGENVVVHCLQDAGPLFDVVEAAPGIVCTSPVQTYLDLAAAGERGREAADHLRREKLAWR